MNKNRKKFVGYEFGINGDPLTLKEQQQILLDMLKKFHDFCELHSFKYCLAYGTLLGCVRHKGFIPWDDDADILMCRADYDKLIKFSEVSERYQIVTKDNTHGYYFPYAHGALVDSQTIMIEHGARFPSGKGQFIDIFPIDGVCENTRTYFKQRLLLDFFSRVKGHQGDSFDITKIKSLKDFIKGILPLILSPFDEMKIINKIDSLAKSYSYDDCTNCAMLVLDVFSRKKIYNKELFENLILHPFEDYYFYIPVEYDKILNKEYGDYMVLPPLSQRVPTHCFDLYYRKNR